MHAHTHTHARTHRYILLCLAYFAQYRIERFIHIFECCYRFFLLITTIKYFIVWTCHSLSILMLMNIIAVSSYGLSCIWPVGKLCMHFCWVYTWEGIAVSPGVHIFSFHSHCQIVSQSVVLILLRFLHPGAIIWDKKDGEEVCFFCF